MTSESFNNSETENMPKKKFIAIVDYGMGNLRSVEKGFEKVGQNVVVTNEPKVVLDADGIVLPGVGAFSDCMRNLKKGKLIDSVIKGIEKGKPYLGICLGLQILFTESEEFGVCKGLDIIKGKVVRFPEKMKEPVPSLPSGLSLEPSFLKVPHMGWNMIDIKRRPPILDGIPDQSYFYFVHSYYVAPEDKGVIATTTDYGVTFTSMVWKDNIFATQFHPEKSQETGLRILKRFGEFVSQDKS